MLQVGNKAPLDIEVTDSLGEPVKLADFLGQTIVLYFYPKDNTPACTKQACSFRDANNDIQALGAKVIGVSKDNKKSHIKFTTEQKLNFDLWSDPDHKLMEGFDTWQEKKFMGKTYMGTERVTFVIDKAGVILEVIYNGDEKHGQVEAQDHGKLALAFLQTLSA